MPGGRSFAGLGNGPLLMLGASMRMLGACLWNGWAHLCGCWVHLWGIGSFPKSPSGPRPRLPQGKRKTGLVLAWGGTRVVGGGGVQGAGVRLGACQSYLLPRDAPNICIDGTIPQASKGPSPRQAKGRPPGKPRTVPRQAKKHDIFQKTKISFTRKNVPPEVLIRRAS